MRKTPEAPSIAGGQKLSSQEVEKTSVLEAKKDPLTLLDLGSSR
jgi:hypothetical protein